MEVIISILNKDTIVITKEIYHTNELYVLDKHSVTNEVTVAGGFYTEDGYNWHKQNGQYVTNFFYYNNK